MPAQEVLIMLGAACGALVAIGVALRKGYVSAQDFFIRANVSMRIINAEMTTNHGGSLLDKVNRIEPNHQAAETHWKALREQQEAMLERIVNVEDAVVQHGVVPCIALNELKRQLEARG